MKLEELRVYSHSMELSEKIWKIVEPWPKFHLDTIGKQLIRSADSIAANISEGYGRYHFKESKHFLFYARGSLFETKTWIMKANNRDLITDLERNQLIESFESLGIALNNYINSIGYKRNK